MVWILEFIISEPMMWKHTCEVFHSFLLRKSKGETTKSGLVITDLLDNFIHGCIQRYSKVVLLLCWLNKALSNWCQERLHVSNSWQPRFWIIPWVSLLYCSRLRNWYMISSSQQEISEDLLKLETSNPTSVAGTSNELDLCEKIFIAVSVEPKSKEVSIISC